MKKTYRKLLAALLCMVMALSIWNVAVMAKEGDTSVSYGSKVDSTSQSVVIGSAANISNFFVAVKQAQKFSCWTAVDISTNTTAQTAIKNLVLSHDGKGMAGLPWEFHTYDPSSTSFQVFPGGTSQYSGTASIRVVNGKLVFVMDSSKWSHLHYGTYGVIPAGSSEISSTSSSSSEVSSTPSSSSETSTPSSSSSETSTPSSSSSETSTPSSSSSETSTPSSSSSETSTPSSSSSETSTPSSSSSETSTPSSSSSETSSTPSSSSETSSTPSSSSETSSTPSSSSETSSTPSSSSETSSTPSSSSETSSTPSSSSEASSTPSSSSHSDNGGGTVVTPTFTSSSDSSSGTIIDDGSTPTAELPVIASSSASSESAVSSVEISDEGVPMADVPQTGDNLGLWIALLSASCGGLAWLAVSGKKHTAKD